MTYRFSNETICRLLLWKTYNYFERLLQGIPNLMKVAEITPVFKKLDNTSKDNYRPINTLSNFAKLFENIIYSQLNDYMENKFSKYLTGFRKNHNTLNSLLRMIESWKATLNNGSKVGVIILDLSGASF